MSDSHTDMLSERQHNQFHSFVAPMNWRFLPQIVNQLDPISFINLASTCKSLHSYCFKSEEIKIKYPIHWMSVTTREGKLMFDLAKREYELNNDGGYDYRPVETDDKSRIFDSVENRKNLQDYPFVVRLNKLQIRDVIDTGFLASFRRFLNEYAVESIVEVDALGINDWDGFVQFLKDFHTQRVFVQTNPCYFGGIFVSGTPMPEEAAKCFLQNTVNFQSDASISDELILNTTMPYLCLPLASICRTTFIDLLKRLAHSTGNMEWTLGRDYFDFDHFDLFKVILFDHDGPLPQDRPLVFVKTDEPRFWILREDETVVRCSYFRNTVGFSTHHSSVFLPCLRRWV